MSRYHSYGDDSWVEVVMLLVLCVILMFGLWACQKGDREKCEERGGVWLSRESACVSGPPVRSGG